MQAPWRSSSLMSRSSRALEQVILQSVQPASSNIRRALRVR